MDTKVIEKIKKLLSLGNSDNEHEARLAAERASELLVRHNLSIQDVKRQDSDYGSHVVRDGYWCETEDKYVTSIIKAHFFVDVFENVTNERHPTARSRRRRLTFVGTKENIEIAAYIYHFLMHEFRMLWACYKVKNKANERSRQSYYLGLFNGLHAQLKDRRQSVEKETGLVVVKDAGLKKYIDNNFGKMKQSKASISDRDASARASGFEEGKNLSIRKGLNDTSERTAQVIQIGGAR
jgi:hypothetical protein